MKSIVLELRDGSLVRTYQHLTSDRTIDGVAVIEYYGLCEFDAEHSIIYVIDYLFILYLNAVTYWKTMGPGVWVDSIKFEMLD